MTGWRKRQVMIPAKEIDGELWISAADHHQAIKEALAQPEQEPVAWDVIDPFGNLVATEKDAIQGWARIEGYKPTVEGLLGFHEQGWRVLPASQRTWVELTEEDLKLLSAEWRIVYGAWMDDFAKDIEAKLKEKNT